MFAKPRAEKIAHYDEDGITSKSASKLCVSDFGSQISVCKHWVFLGLVVYLR
jgi:hypothetical protein